MIRARRGRAGGRGVDAAFVLVVMAILAFAFTNGFHDAANAIAPLVATQGARRRRPGPAIILAAVCNMLGPRWCRAGQYRSDPRGAPAMARDPRGDGRR